MKTVLKYLHLLLGAFLITSCIEPTPNDRAMFNLIGPVSTVDYDNSESLTFYDDGTFYYDLTSSKYKGEIKRSYARLEFIPEGTEDIIIYEFDSQGRLSVIQEKAGDIKTTTEFSYKKKEKLPRSKKVTTTDGEKETVEEGDIEYGQVDDYGNWLSMTWNGKTVTREILYKDTFGATDTENCPMDKTINWPLVWETLLAILFVLLSIAMIAHMIYERFIKRPLPENYTVEYFKEERKHTIHSSETADNEKAAALLSELYMSWTLWDNENDTRMPFSRRDVKRTYSTLEEVVRLAPTDEETVLTLNKISIMMNTYMERSFTGSKTFIIISIIMAIILCLMAEDFKLLGMIGTSSVIYFLASLTPAWMMIKKEMKGTADKPKFMTAIISALFGSIATAETYKVVTKWSDGTTSVRDDTSNFWITTILVFLALAVLSLFMFFVAAFNYIRNYILYW